MNLHIQSNNKRKTLKLKILKLVAGSIQWILPAFLFSDRVLVYSIDKAGVLNRFVDIVVHIFRLLYLDYYIYLDLFGIY